MKKQNEQRKLLVLTWLNISICAALTVYAIFFLIAGGGKSLSPYAVLTISAAAAVRIILDYFHDRIKNKSSCAYLRRVIRELEESIERKNDYIRKLHRIIAGEAAERPNPFPEPEQNDHRRGEQL
jgi:uncharacterized membrane-anchored protein YitT (DUF2179 family)